MAAVMVAGVCARSTCRRQRMRRGLAASNRNGPCSGKKAAVTQVLVRFADDRSGSEDKHQRCAVLCRELCAKVKEDDEETDLLLHHLSKFDKQLSARRRKRRAHQMAVASQPPVMEVVAAAVPEVPPEVVPEVAQACPETQPLPFVDL